LTNFQHLLECYCLKRLILTIFKLNYMFAKSVPTGGISNKDAETIIGSSVKVEGNFICEGNMIIDGEVKGTVQTNGFLQVGDRAVINADIKAANSKIGGQVKGSVKIDGDLELTETAKIFGDVEASSLSVARGALLNGKCSMAKENSKNKKDKEIKAAAAAEEEPEA